MEYNNLEYDFIDEQICQVKVDNSKGLNILNVETLNELGDLLGRLNSIEALRVVIITGKGKKAFICGADIKEMAGMDYHSSREYSKLAMNTFMKIYESNKMYIAAINGIALGGGVEITLFCDLRIASDSSTFGNPEVSLGITCGFSGTQMLSRIIGISNAKDMLLTGRRIDAKDALNKGLVNYLYSQEELMEKTIEIAKGISKNSYNALQKTKYLVNRSIDLQIKEGLELETEIFSQCFNSDESKKFMEAFLLKKGRG